MKRYKVGTVIFGILFGIMIITVLASAPSIEDKASLIPMGIVTGIFGLFLLVNIIMNIITKSSEPIKVAKPISTVSGTLVDGLPIPASVMVITKLYDEKIELVAMTGMKESEYQHFELEINKIQKAMVLNENQVQQIVTQSAPGMIIGAAAFGLLGAMVGGRVKTKQKVKLKFLFLLEYVSDGENKQILLNLGDYSLQGESFVKKLNAIKPLTNETPIQL